MKSLKKLVFLILPLFGVGFYLVKWCYIENHYVELWDLGMAHNWEATRHLLLAGANPSDTSDLQNFRTPLYWAVWSSKVDIVNLYISKGVDLNIIDTHDDTALDWAKMVLRIDPHNPDALKVLNIIKAAGAKGGEEVWQELHKKGQR